MLINQKSRMFLIVLLGLILFGSLVLSMSLTGISLRGEIDSPVLSTTEIPKAVAVPGTSVRTPPLGILQAVAAIGFLVFVIYLGVRLFKIVIQHSNAWRGIWKLIVPMLGLVVLMVFLGNIKPVTTYETSHEEIMLTPTVTAPIQEAREMEPPPSVRWVVLAAVMTGLGIIVFQKSRKVSHPDQNDPIKQKAANAVVMLQNGEDFRNVILRCYFEMSRVIREENGIEREPEKTVREFEADLVSRGFDFEPIHQLGQLFEKARYSDQPINNADEESGIACLQKIATQTGWSGKIETDQN